MEKATTDGPVLVPDDEPVPESAVGATETEYVCAPAPDDGAPVGGLGGCNAGPVSIDEAERLPGDDGEMEEEVPAQMVHVEPDAVPGAAHGDAESA